MAIPEELKGKYFYHFTHVENLESILQHGFLSTNEKNKLGIKHTDIANGNIQGRRANMPVTCGPGGTVHDYVPFYLCTMNPMLLSLVNHKNIDQMFMIFFAIPIDKIIDANVVFTDASANTVEHPNFYENGSDLNKLNWESISSIKWGVKNDLDRHQKMAEVLVYKSLTFDDVNTIIVWNDSIKDHVKSLLEQYKEKKCNVTFQPFNGKYFYYTKFHLNRNDETLTTGPFWLKKTYERTIKKIIKKREEQNKFNYKCLKDFIKAIKANFSIIGELEGIHNLKTANEVHDECVSDHTLSVVSKLEGSKCFQGFDESDREILIISAYLHDIGKGPKTMWKNEIQQTYPDHPVDSLKMIKRILVEEIENLTEYQIKMICLLVGYHDLIGEIFGKGRDKKQLFNLLKDKKEFDMLNCLSFADVLSFNNHWYLTYGYKIEELKKEFLEQLDK